MKNFITSGWLSLLLPFLCLSLARATSMHGVDEQLRKISNFHAIENSGSIDLEITMGTTESLRIIGDHDLIEQVETIVENGVLKIRMKKGFQQWFNGFGTGRHLAIQIQAKNLDALKQTGSGDILVKNTINSSELSVAVSGSGDIRVPLSTDQLYLSIVGSGDISAKGIAKSADVKITGSGDFDGTHLKSHLANVKISGSGNADIYVDETLNASISGSGDIHYSGAPKNINKKKSGSGDIYGN